MFFVSIFASELVKQLTGMETIRNELNGIYNFVMANGLLSKKHDSFACDGEEYSKRVFIHLNIGKGLEIAGIYINSCAEDFSDTTPLSLVASFKNGFGIQLNGLKTETLAVILNKLKETYGEK